MIDLLLQPDVAYLFIVVGLILSVLALLTPGTGFIEIGAFFALAVAGYQIYSLEINPWAILVSLVGVALFFVAVRSAKNRYSYLGAASLALVIGSVFFFRGEETLSAVNPLLAVIVSLLSVGFLWLIATKTVDVHLKRPNHDLGVLLGSIGTAKTSVHDEGTVFVHMEDWSAQSDDEIPAGSKVRIVGREGLILRVELEQEAAE